MRLTRRGDDRRVVVRTERSGSFGGTSEGHLRRSLRVKSLSPLPPLAAALPTLGFSSVFFFPSFFIFLLFCFPSARARATTSTRALVARTRLARGPASFPFLAFFPLFSFFFLFSSLRLAFRRRATRENEEGRGGDEWTRARGRRGTPSFGAHEARAPKLACTDRETFLEGGAGDSRSPACAFDQRHSNG